MSDHDTADRALVERLQAMYARCVFQRPCDEHEAFKEAAAALARRIAEGERLKKLLAKAAPWTCPECGPHVMVDEEGCCATCGADAVLVAEEPPRD